MDTAQSILIVLLLLNCVLQTHHRGVDLTQFRPDCSKIKCPYYSYCKEGHGCRCRNGLIGTGEKCVAAPGRTPCKSNSDCKIYSECGRYGICYCRDELLGDGTTCKQAPRHKCKTDKDCHSFAICLTGHCICQFFNSGNGKFCRIGSYGTGCRGIDRCGWNALCIVDPLMPNHGWCQCKIATDKNGDCLECTKDEHCKSKYGICRNNKCVCEDELIRSWNGCAANRNLHKCKDNSDCHEKAKCEDGACYCQGLMAGNGRFCRDAKHCTDWTLGCAARGICIIDPLLPDNIQCKCNKGYFEDFPWGCVECRTNKDCPVFALCVNRYCKCRTPLVRKGKSCVAAPLQKCRNSRDCHAKAKCFYGKCVCQGDRTGNGRFCRDTLPCSTAQSVSCGNHSACLLDPIFPNDPICRCLKGFEMSRDNKCIDIDECKSGKARCGHRCQNTVGSFHCEPCPQGYTEGENGACLAPIQCDCGENEECVNEECVCIEGYEINKYGDCVWPEEEWLSMDKSSSIQASSCVLVALGLLMNQVCQVISIF